MMKTNKSSVYLLFTQYFRTWTGPVSVAVFSTKVEMDAILVYIEHLRKCDAKVKDQVAFHFLTPTDSPKFDSHVISNSRKELIKLMNQRDFCSDKNSLMKKLFQLKR